MWALIPTLLLLFNFSTSLGDDEPTFPPPAYHYKAEQIDQSTQEVILYEFWNDENLNRSRLDFYDGLDTKFFDTSNKTIATMVHYVADANGNTKRVCSIEKESTEPVETLLPKFDYINIHERNYSRIAYMFTKDFGITKEMLFTYGKPFKLIVKKFKKGNVKLVKHNIINYKLFERKLESSSVLEYDEKDCINRLPKKYEELEYLIQHHDPNIQSHVDAVFDKYKNHHSKTYAADEYEMRRNILRDNWRKVKEHNEQNQSYKLTLNKFADRTPEELVYLTRGVIPHKYDPGTHPFPYDEAQIHKLVEDIPEEWDWRITGNVSKVKNQGACGSCWAFAGAAAMESALSIKHGRQFELSEQAIIDCAWPYTAFGCNGGSNTAAYQLAMKFGIPNEDDYKLSLDKDEYGPYLEVDGKCSIKNHNGTFKIKGYSPVLPRNEEALKLALYRHGPVSATINVDEKFELYDRGIYKNVPTNRGFYHGVVVVGYGNRDGIPYWIVKNSWGQDWGLDGYILISSRNNAANLMSHVSYLPIV